MSQNTTFCDISAVFFTKRARNEGVAGKVKTGYKIGMLGNEKTADLENCYATGRIGYSGLSDAEKMKGGKPL